MSFWDGKAALVTGGSAGLGKVLAVALAARGCRVAICGRREAALQAAAEEIRSQTGQDVLAIVADVTRDEDVERMVAEIVERSGRLDLLANCVGRSSRGAILDVSPDDFQAWWELNFLAAVRCTRAAAPHLLKAKGHIVNIGSLASKLAPPYLGPYPAGKFALAAYSQQLRLEFGRQGLHVLLVCPGPIARADAGQRYAREAEGLPPAAAKPGGGAKIKAIDPERVAAQIVRACERRRRELVVPRKARLLCAVSQLFPAVGDWLLERMSGREGTRGRGDGETGDE